jgi:hypothetical protein
MDRSYLSRSEVVAASRAFVCVRLTTYENQEEADLLRSIFVGRSGDVENTTFALLSPDGKQPLVRSGRSPRLGSASQMAEVMNRIAQEYPGQNGSGDPELPKVPNVRLALDVAACDNQPMVLLFGNAAGLQQFEKNIRKLAWSSEFLGRAVYASTTDREQLKAIDGIASGSGLIVVQPDRYGLKGKVLAQTTASAATAEMARVLRDGMAQHQRSDKNHHQHVREGHRAGILWETQIPVTDPMERRARQQGRDRPPPP